MSGPIGVLEKEKYRPIDNFMNTSFDFNHIKKVCKNFRVIHGEDDQSVPISHGENLSLQLNCNLVRIPNGGHLSGGDGISELPEVLDAILKMVSSEK